MKEFRALCAVGLVSLPVEIARSFSVAADKIAAVDGVVGRRETLLIERYTAALTTLRGRTH